MVAFANCNKKQETIGIAIEACGDYIKLNTKGTVNPKSYHVYYYEENEKSWLFYGNRDNNEMLIYSLPTGEIEKKIKYEYKGPNGIGSFKGALIHNFDSIFVISGTHYNSFFLTDSSGKVINKYNLQKVGKYAPAIMPLFSHIHQEHVIFNQNINISTILFTDIENDELYQEVLSFDYDMLGSRIKEIYTYPKFQKNIKQTLDGYSRTFDGERFIYSFGRLEELFAQDFKGNFNNFYAKSTYQMKDLNWFNDPVDPILKQKEQSIKNPIYLSIIFDKYRNCFYRFFKPGYNKKYNIEDIEKLREYPYQFSVLILDRDLNIIGETLMPEKTYDPYMVFVSIEGLYMALHIDHPLYNPDLLTFERITLINGENVLRK